MRTGLSHDEREFLNEQNDNLRTASHGERMDKDKKILPKNFLNDTFESGDLGEMTNKELKKYGIVYSFRRSDQTIEAAEGQKTLILIEFVSLVRIVLRNTEQEGLGSIPVFSRCKGNAGIGTPAFNDSGDRSATCTFLQTGGSGTAGTFHRHTPFTARICQGNLRYFHGTMM